MRIKKFFKEKNVLITGHTGFKGSWLAKWIIKNQGKVQVATIQAEADMKIADMKDDLARDTSDVAHVVKNKQIFLKEKAQNDAKANLSKAQSEAEAREVSPQRKKRIQDIIKNS